MAGDIKPKSHNKQNESDVQSIGLVQNLLARHGRVLPQLYVVDKWPNIDGYIDIQNENRELLGRIDVQVKTIPTGNLKFSCPTSFLSNCELRPCILMGVNNAKDEIYWTYLDGVEVKKLSVKPGSKTKKIEFNPNNVISKEKKTHIEEWVRLAEKNTERINNHDDLKAAYDDLRAKSNDAIGESDEKFESIHTFLDYLNGLLDGDFNLVKRRYYPSAWKLGMAIYEYEDTSLSYTLYPVSRMMNDVQIKYVDSQLREDLNKKGLGFRGHFVANPLLGNPKEYAVDLIKDWVDRLLKTHNLFESNNDMLRAEYIFYALDVLEDSWKFPIKDRHYVHEIVQNTPIRDVGNGTHYVNGKQVNQGKLRHLIFLELQDDELISRPNKRFDYTNLKTGMVYDFYSEEDANNVLGNILENLPAAYSDIVHANFPLLEKELDYWKYFDLVLFSTNFERTSEPGLSPTYKLYRLQSANGDGQKIFKKAPKGLIQMSWEEMKSKRPFNFEGKDYQIVSVSDSVLDFIYHDLPLYHLTMDTLDSRLNDYFNSEI